MADQEIIDFGWDNYLKELDEKLTYVDVGVLASDGAKVATDKDGSPTGLTLAEKATAVEYGTDRSDSRPFIRQTFDENENTLNKLVVRLDNQVLQGKISRKQSLNQIGQTHQNQIQDNMQKSGKWEENAQSTIDRKGSAQPTIDTGQLRQAINFEVG